MLDSLIRFLKKHNERATIIGLVFGLVVCVGLGFYLQKLKSNDKEVPSEQEPATIELQVEQGEATGESGGSVPKTRSFLLRPSPAELLEQLSAMENLQEDVAQSKLQHLRVLWPVYYFSLESNGGRESLLLDISEDGFGAEVRGNVNSADYPQLKGLSAGNKIWVAGQIQAVDPSGTGTVYLNIELLDFTEDGPHGSEVQRVVTSEK